MYDTIIIGAGIAGMSAAMYAARKKMKYEILSTDVGGQFMVSGEVENYPGIVKTTGIEFANIMKEQLKFNNVKVKLETVKEIKKIEKDFKIITDQAEYDTKTIIIATGSKARKIGVPGEEEFAKKGVTYCSICDGPIFSGMDVAVVGAGNSALEAVDFLKDIVDKMYMLVRGDKFSGHEYLIERVKNTENVEVLFNANTTEILGEEFVSGLKYEQDGQEKQIDVRGVIIEIGRVPNTDPFKGLIEFDEDNHIIVDCQGHTSQKGVFAAGDCASGHEYQYIISAGQGAMALIKAARYLTTRND